MTMKTTVYITLLIIYSAFHSSLLAARVYLPKREIDRPLTNPKFMCQNEHEIFIREVIADWIRRDKEFHLPTLLLLQSFFFPPSYAVTDKLQGFFGLMYYNYLRFGVIHNTESKNNIVRLTGPNVVVDWGFYRGTEEKGYYDTLPSGTVIIEHDRFWRNDIGVMYKQKFSNRIWLESRGYVHLANIDLLAWRLDLLIGFQVFNVLSLKAEYLVVFGIDDEYVRKFSSDDISHNAIAHLDLNPAKCLSIDLMVWVNLKPDDIRVFPGFILNFYW